MSAARLLLLRRSGGLWGVIQDEVRTVRGDGDGYTVLLAEESLAADEVVGVVEGVAVRPAGGVLASYWGVASGLAVWTGTPLVVVDTKRPPACLRPETDDGETR